MEVSVGTFNLNNLFSRLNFEAEIDAIVEDDPDSGLTATYTFNDPETVPASHRPGTARPRQRPCRPGHYRRPDRRHGSGCVVRPGG
jgi:hypothetical protein